jgi:hypothetical protein
MRPRDRFTSYIVIARSLSSGIITVTDQIHCPGRVGSSAGCRLQRQGRHSVSV